MQRREFIRTSCVSCAGLLGASVLLSALNGCSPLPVLKASSTANTVIVPKDSFKEGQDLLIIKNPALAFDILLVRKKDNTYNALYMECTHQSQPLSANKTGLFCSAHGSGFDLDGNVTMEPAARPLRKFKTDLDNTNIRIYLN